MWFPCTLSDQHGLRQVLNTNKNNGKHTYTWKRNNALLSDDLVKEEIKKLKSSQNLMKMKTHHTKTYGTLKAVVGGKLTALSASKRKLKRAYSRNLTAHLKALEKEKERYSPKESRLQILFIMRQHLEWNTCFRKTHGTREV